MNDCLGLYGPNKKSRPRPSTSAYFSVKWPQEALLHSSCVAIYQMRKLRRHEAEGEPVPAFLLKLKIYLQWQGSEEY